MGLWWCTLRAPKTTGGTASSTWGNDFHDSIAVDDIGYIHALIEYLQASLQVSATNVFSMGMSNGGDMSYMLACQSDVVKAIAPSLAV